MAAPGALGPLSVRKGDELPVASLAVLFRQYKGLPYDASKHGLLEDEALAQLSAQLSTGLVEQTNVSYFDTTVRYCAVLHAYGRPPELLDYGNLVIYVLHLCLKERVRGTTAGQYVSHVRSIGGAAGWPDKQAPGTTQRAMLKNVLRGLKKAFPSTSAVRQPVRLVHLEKIRAEMDRQVALSPDSAARIDFQWLALCVSHQLMLRASELVNLAVGDVSAYDDTSSGGGKGLVVSLRNTKTARDGQVFRVHLHARSDRFNCAAGVRALASGRAPDEPLIDFRGRLAGAVTTAEGVFQNKQANIMTQVVRCWLAASGQVADAETMACYAAHSLRHGGCTDLLDSGVPLDTVMRQGRWKSAAWLIYKHTTEVTRSQLSLLAPAWRYARSGCQRWLWAARLAR
jgi:integrase